MLSVAEVVVTLHWRRLAMSQAANDLENVPLMLNRKCATDELFNNWNHMRSRKKMTFL